MTEQESSGGSAPVAANAAPAHTAGTTAAFQASDASASSAFGATRGSGLARGKRNAQRPAQSESTPSLDYKPTSIEVITPTREYSNPFASETPASAPVETPAPVAPVVVQAAPVIPVAAPAPVETIPEPVAFQAEPEAPAPVEKSEIKILPPEETKRTSVSWDSSSPAFPDEQPKSNGPRPVFTPKPRAGSENHRGDVMPPRNRNAERPYVGGPSDETAPAAEVQAPRDEQRPRNDRPRRDDRPKFDGPREDRPKFDGPREDRPKFDGPRSDRRDGRRDGPREPRNDFRRDRPVEAPVSAAAAPKSGGFIAWLKGLFGKKPEVTETPRPDSQNRHGDHGGRGPRRDGRGRGGEHRPHNSQRQGGPGEGQGQSQGGGQHGFRQGEGEGRGGEGGQRRRRRGRGRGRGGYNGGHESEGQQGGGAI